MGAKTRFSTNESKFLGFDLWTSDRLRTSIRMITEGVTHKVCDTRNNEVRYHNNKPLRPHRRLSDGATTMRVILSVTVAVAVGLPLACSAQQPPPPAPSLRSESIPGGVLHYAGKGLLADPAEDVSLSVANHSLRAYWLTSPGQVPGTPGPPTIYADGQPLIVTESDLPRIEAVLTGGGHTYVRVAEGVDEDDPPYLWIVDVSAPVQSSPRE